ncbi:MAG TPA: ATP-binding protein [Syntrophales bacterium]|nr:ATP-binding protein [Syntrophales bacterium]
MEYFQIVMFGLVMTAVVGFVYSAWKREENEQRLYSVIQASAIPIFVIRKDHKIVYWNRALEILSGIQADEVLGTDQHWRAFYKIARPCMADLVVDDTLETIPNWYSGKFRKSKLIEKAYEAVDFFPELGNGGRWLRFTASAIKDSRGHLFGAIETLEDVTEQRIAEEELVKIKKLESIDTFASGVAEDFDRLTSAVLRNIFLAKLSADDQDEILGEGLTIAEKASLQAKELSHQLITLARGGYPMRKVEPIGQLIREAVENAPKDCNVQYLISIQNDLPSVELDRKQIHHVFENIIRNAVEAMPEGGIIEFHAESIAIGAENILQLSPGKYVRISIRDTGHGIKKENLTRVFDPYFTTKTNNAKKGLGLGLAICHSVIKNHHGSITVESEAGEGTVFRLLLPSSSLQPEARTRQSSSS